ncbi:MAG: transporter, partial [Gammaproteobacteria bacterium]|nr:transporter [Gammaproteobacteria bacterium]
MLAVALAGGSFGVTAAPVTFNTALPVAKGEWIWREMAVFRERDDGTALPGAKIDVLALANVLGYGINSRFVLFGVLPYFATKELEVSTAAGRISRDTSGIGDLSLFGRYEVYRRDRPGRTFRVAPFAGVIAPTGDDDDRDRFGELPRPLQAGTGAWGGLGGAVASYQTLRYQFDAQIAYAARGTDRGFQAGDELRFDVSYQHRLWPRTLGAGVPGFLYGVLESNVVYAGRDGRNVDNSGGTQWFLTPGLQYVTRRWVVEAAVQLPVLRDMHGDAIRDDYIVQGGF